MFPIYYFKRILYLRRKYGDDVIDIKAAAMTYWCSVLP